MYIGIDLHKANAVVTALDVAGQDVLTTKVKNTRSGWEEFRELFPDGGEVVLESTLNHMEVVDLLEGWGYTVSVAHSKDVRAIATSKSKTDKIDSRILAKLLQSDFLPRAYVPPKEIRQMRELLRHRIRLGRDAAQVKNRVHALLQKNWIAHDFTDLFGKGGRKYLASIALPDLIRQVMESLLRQLDTLEKEVKNIQATLAQHAVQDENIKRLMQIRGIDFYSAEVIVNEIGDVTRFPSYRKLSSYAGLVPTVRNSGNTVRHGHITKEGNRNLRWILVEAALKSKETDPNLKKTYNRISRRRGMMIARIAVARHLLRIIYYMLRDKSDYHYVNEIRYEAKTRRMHYATSPGSNLPKEANILPSRTLTRRPTAPHPIRESLIYQGGIQEARTCFS